MNKPSITVLLVEPEGAYRQLYKTHLEKEGYIVLLADDGREAIRMMKAHVPDVIVLEWMIRDWAGLNVLHKAIDQPVRIPVIINTMYGKIQQTYFTLLADRVLIKSWDVNALTEAIRACCEPQHRDFPEPVAAVS